MEARTLRRWHRNVALVLAPVLLVQALSGLLLSLRFPGHLAELVSDPAAMEAVGTLTRVLVQLHVGHGLISDLYHLLLVLAILWVVVTGTWIWFDLRRRRKSA